MWPHGILGLSWGELAALVAIITAIYAAFHSMLKGFGDSIAKPLLHQLGELSKAIDDLSKNSLSEHHTIDKRLDKHDVRLGVHDAEIGTLYSTVGLDRKGKHDEAD